MTGNVCLFCGQWPLRSSPGIMGGVGVALDYGRAKAPGDVLGSLDWLADEGFVLAGERGGPSESFGNLLVVFERSSLAVRIIRDRGQWSVDLAAGGGEFIPLHVLLTAWQGGMPALGDRQVGARLPEVFPQGVEWRVVLPGIVSWLESGNRTREISEARAAWKAAIMRWLASQRGQA